MSRWIDDINSRIALGWSSLWDTVVNPEPDLGEANEIVLKAKKIAPVIWMLGKVQSGKTSIVRVITQSSDAEIGIGFKACTQTAKIFDFPAEAPVLRFLDTRGLGEVSYDPTEDMEFCEEKANLILIAMKALDPQQESVVEVIKSVRDRHPDWPIVVAQTCLHESYQPGGNHVLPYPYSADLENLVLDSSISPVLVRSLNYQRSLFENISGPAPILFVPIDFTIEEDGFSPIEYGIDALIYALQEAAPETLVSILYDLNSSDIDPFTKRSNAHILGYSTAASAADIIPVAGIVAVSGVQAKMLHSLAGIYDAEWDKRTLGEFAGCLGTGTVVRLLASLGIRQLVKLVPVYGQTAGTATAMATSFATTFALGKAACFFLEKRKLGISNPDGVIEIYKRELTKAFRVAKKREQNPNPGGE